MRASCVGTKRAMRGSMALYQTSDSYLSVKQSVLAAIRCSSVLEFRILLPVGARGSREHAATDQYAQPELPAAHGRLSRRASDG
jgi:hypothetical protein